MSGWPPTNRERRDMWRQIRRQRLDKGDIEGARRAARIARLVDTSTIRYRDRRDAVQVRIAYRHGQRVKAPQEGSAEGRKKEA